jgi:two-component system, chemotaxis family, sensor kinase Cph1
VKKQNRSSLDAVKLRQKAEEILKTRKFEKDLLNSETDIHKLIHQLEVHQIELEMQNDELVMAIEKAQLTEEKYTELYDFAPTGYLSLSKKGEILEINFNAALMLGKKRSQLINRNFELFLFVDTLHCFSQFFQRIFNSLVKQNCEVIIVQGGNSPIYVNIDGILSQNQELCLLSLTDITERKRTETDLIKLNLELSESKQSIMKMLEKLSIANNELSFQNQINETLEQVLYVASHNLQEPLRAISNYIQVFEEDYSMLFDEQAKQYLRSLHNSANRMKLLIKALMETARLGRHSKLVRVDINKIVDQVVTDLETQINSSNAIIEVNEMPELYVYEIELQLLFQNLIDNAIKFRKKNTPPIIKISAEKIDEYWKFTVSDNGFGINPVHQERIFVIFQRLHTDEDYEGNGVGLAICKKIVDLHHGKIWVESSVGEGSAFHFTLPILL